MSEWRPDRIRELIERLNARELREQLDARLREAEQVRAQVRAHQPHAPFYPERRRPGRTFTEQPSDDTQL
jgi:hypothetical protein